MNKEIQVVSALNTVASRTLGIKNYKGNTHLKKGISNNFIFFTAA